MAGSMLGGTSLLQGYRELNSGIRSQVKKHTKTGEPYTPSTARTGTYRTHRTAHNRSKLRPVHFKRGSATDWTLKWIRNRLDPKVDPQQTGP